MSSSVHLAIVFLGGCLLVAAGVRRGWRPRHAALGTAAIAVSYTHLTLPTIYSV